MPKITYLVPDGTAHSGHVTVGQSVMDGSVRNNLPGIVAECGGSCSCATCHVHVAPESAHLFDPPTEEERDLLKYQTFKTAYLDASQS